MNWSVGRKIALGFGLALLILLIVALVSYRTTTRLIATADSVDQTHRVLEALEEIISYVKDVQSAQRGYLITGDESYLEPYTMALGPLQRALESARAGSARTREEQARFDHLNSLIEKRIAWAQTNIETRRTAGFEAAQSELLTGTGKRLTDEIRQMIREMEAEQRTLLNTRDEEARAVAARAVTTIRLGMTAAILALAIAGIIIARSISQPLQEITRIADRIGHGDLNVEFSTNGRSDEVGALMQSFLRMSRSLKVVAGRAKQIAAGDLTGDIRPQSENDVLGTAFSAMTQNLRGIIQDLVEAVNILAVSTNDIMASSSQLATTAGETATSVTETTTTVEQVKQTSQVSSDKARYVSDEAQRAAGVALGGKQAVAATAEGIDVIRQQMRAIAESIRRLSAQSQAIGEIIASVDDLAAQSKLLAVNASIEAAKAGDEGKGFSVVAQEVRSLAEQSKQATAQVRTILGDIQKATSGAVLATEQGSKAVENGARQSTSAGESIGALAESIAQAAQAATQIAATSQQQSVGMDQVALAMMNIKTASTQTLASTRQAENAAQQLHALGQKLKTLVDRFKV